MGARGHACPNAVKNTIKQIMSAEYINLILTSIKTSTVTVCGGSKDFFLRVAKVCDEGAAWVQNYCHGKNLNLNLCNPPSTSLSLSFVVVIKSEHISLGVNGKLFLKQSEM